MNNFARARDSTLQLKPIEQVNNTLATTWWEMNEKPMRFVEKKKADPGVSFRPQYFRVYSWGRGWNFATLGGCRVLCFILLYLIILYYIVLYYVILYHIMIYYITFYYITWYYVISYHIMFCYGVIFYIILY